MAAYVARRALQAAVALVGVSLIVFALIWMLPGGPQKAMLGLSPSAAQVSHFRHDYGLSSPWVLRYLIWLGHVLHGNLGYSYLNGESVGTLLMQSAPRTLVLTVTATMLAALLAIPAGLVQAARPDGVVDWVLRVVSYLFYGTPAFLLGAVLVLVFAVQWHIFGAQAPQAPGLAAMIADWRDLTLPVLTLTALAFATFARYMRASALESLAQDYVRTARAKGANQRRVLSRHVLRNSAVPLITLAGLSLPRILAGAIVVEAVFNLQGMGWELWQAALNYDFPVLLGFVLVIGVATVLGSVLADLGYAVIDPRVRHGVS